MITAIFLSGGIGSRMGHPIPKQYRPIAGRPLALHSFEQLQKNPLITEMIVVCHPQYASLFPNVPCAIAGNRRQDSLFNGLQLSSSDNPYILVHDAARPILKSADIDSVIAAALEYGAATLATPVTTTIKQADSQQMVKQTLERSTLFQIQTPQVLKKELLLNGFEKARRESITVTDDVSFAELLNSPVKLVIGSEENIKVTTPQDFTLAETLAIHI